ncbi:SDR family NAD(P)-dependent oxidoreductase [Nocardioides carbamazepini]|uniref:SDR family NAD(P)-dependent oxidoreductase n=1 Tax=Nocardioides carbamazepini TaxID=2854259 RepID=UPI00214A36DD|nr:SDR family NAD(P)-dependent oxidoreductase [Nocardioides carbamazepini]MCR1784923.1 SDR family NAD(P)-dependent oxidoreductase [Nocardioides carbamazepini]
MDLTSSSVLVVGGATGLGRAVAEELAPRCAHLVVADLNADRAAEVESVAGHVTFVTTDVTDDESVRRAVAVARETAPLRCAVATAGIVSTTRILGRRGVMDTRDFRKVVDVNLVGSASVISHAAAAMVANNLVEEERGLIVLTSSIAGFDGGQLAYSASKAGVAAMVQSAAFELAEHAVRVVGIAPGIFDTGMFDGTAPAVQALENSIPHPRRRGRPVEFARMVATILDTPMLNGEVIRLDGAMRLPRIVPRSRPTG